MLGDGGWYLAQEAYRKERGMLILGLAALGIIAWTGGFLYALDFHRTRLPLLLSHHAIALIVVFLTWRWFHRRLPQLAKLSSETTCERAKQPSSP